MKRMMRQWKTRKLRTPSNRTNIIPILINYVYPAFAIHELYIPNPLSNRLASKAPLPKVPNHPTLDSVSAITKPKPGGTIFDPLEWSAFFDRREMLNNIVPVYFAGTKGHVFICMHGAGHSAMAFAALARFLKGESIIAAFDFRGHGGHYCENELDLSEETLIEDSI